MLKYKCKNGPAAFGSCGSFNEIRKSSLNSDDNVKTGRSSFRVVCIGLRFLFLSRTFELAISATAIATVDDDYH